jgi:hypothetical protein
MDDVSPDLETEVPAEELTLVERAPAADHDRKRKRKTK